jgi:hypothetical protein
VHRVERDSVGGAIRIVTWPATTGVLDGMAIVRVDRGCRITSLVQTDSG